MADEKKSRADLLEELHSLRARLVREAGEDWYRQAVEEAPNPVLLVDAHGMVRSWNRASEALLAPPDVLAEAHLASLVKPQDGRSVETLIAEAWSGASVLDVEVCCACQEGNERTLLSRFYPAHGPDGVSVIGCVFAGTDVTERVQFERELVAAKEAAEEAVHLKSTILNNLSHEIRTPLTAILGFAELLFEEVPDPYREFVHLIRSSGKRLMGTLVAVLELARLESGDVRFEVEDVDLREEASEAVRMFTPLAEAKGLRLTFEGPGRPLPARVDRIALNRVLSNLLSNAIKFTPDGYVRLSLIGGRSAVAFHVSDSGIGIGAGFLPHLFEEFKQESEGLGRRHEGAGLGLAITKRLIEQMGGSINVESEKGRGTTFTVRLPRVTP